MRSGWKVCAVMVAVVALSATVFGQEESAPAGNKDLQALPPLALTAGNYDAGSAAGAALGDLRLAALPAPVSTVGIAPLILRAEETGGGRNSGGYVDAKLGAIWFEDDLDDLDTGILAEVAYGQRIVRFLAIEAFSGYVWGEETGGTVEAEMWGIPFGVNAKVFIPIPIVEPYAGVGIGGWWLNFEVDTPVGDDDDDDLVLGGQFFLGAHVTLGPVFAGVEGRYIVTEDADVFNDEIALEGWAFLVSGGLEF